MSTYARVRGLPAWRRCSARWSLRGCRSGSTRSRSCSSCAPRDPSGRRADGLRAAADLVGDARALPAAARRRPCAGPGRLRAGLRLTEAIFIVGPLIGAMLPVGVALGALEVALPAFADLEGRRELAGVLLAVWSLGSAAGGLAYGARPRTRPLARVHLMVAVLLPAFLAPLVLAGSPLAMGLLLIPAGIFIAPLIATRKELAGVVASAGSETEAYSWPLTALVVGVALGASSGGILIDSAGWRAAVVLAVCTSAAGAVVSLTRRRTLRGVAPIPA